LILSCASRGGVLTRATEILLSYKAFADGDAFFEVKLLL